MNSANYLQVRQTDFSGAEQTRRWLPSAKVLLGCIGETAGGGNGFPTNVIFLPNFSAAPQKDKLSGMSE